MLEQLGNLQETLTKLDRLMSTFQLEFYLESSWRDPLRHLHSGFAVGREALYPDPVDLREEGPAVPILIKHLEVTARKILSRGENSTIYRGTLNQKLM